jgi:hypothetical protein
VGQKVSDGIDTLRGIENLKFSDQTVQLRTPGPPTILTATSPASGQVNLTWSLAAAVAPAATSQQIVISTGTTVVRTITGLTATQTSRNIVNGFTNGVAYTFRVRAVNAIGLGQLSAPVTVTPRGEPPVPVFTTLTRGNGSVTVSWTIATDGGSPLTSNQILIRTAGAVLRTDTVAGSARTATLTGLTNGTAYRFRVTAVNALGSNASVLSDPVTPATVPNAPGIAAPTQGPAGGALTAVANWTAPANTGGDAITSYRVSALRMAADGVTPAGAPTVIVTGATARNRSFTLPAGNYRFEVVAVNSVGDSLPSARSALIAPR